MLVCAHGHMFSLLAGQSSQCSGCRHPIPLELVTLAKTTEVCGEASSTHDPNNSQEFVYCFPGLGITNSTSLEDNQQTPPQRLLLPKVPLWRMVVLCVDGWGHLLGE